MRLKLFHYLTFVISVILCVISFLAKDETNKIILLHTSVVFLLLGLPLKMDGFYTLYLFFLLSRLAINYNLIFTASSLSVMMIVLIIIILIRYIGALNKNISSRCTRRK